MTDSPASDPSDDPTGSDPAAGVGESSLPSSSQPGPDPRHQPAATQTDDVRQAAACGPVSEPPAAEFGEVRTGKLEREWQRPIWDLLLWTAIAMGLAFALMAVAIQSLMAIELGLEGMQVASQRQAWVRGLIERPVGLVLLMLPGQISFLFVGIVAAGISPIPFRDRLGLQRGRGTWSNWLMFFAATPAVSLFSTLAVSLLVRQRSENMEVLRRLISENAATMWPLLITLICICPAIAEEILFRGLIQRRLVRRYTLIPAIGISSLLFAAAHLEPIHALGVAPLGFWFGLVAWKTDSTWAASGCHFINNFMSTMMAMVFMGAESPERLDPLSSGIVTGIYLASMGALFFSVRELFRPAVSAVESSPASRPPEGEQAQRTED